jgi:transglutaminase-like putative cysteine protease
MIYEPFVEGVGIVSPSQTLEWAAGDCVDFSFLLASLLIGAG